MKTTEEIRTSNSNNKTANYIELVKFYMEDSKDTAEVTGNVFVVRIAKEISILAKNVFNADCEFTAYVNCNAAEIWFSKIDEQF